MMIVYVCLQLWDQVSGQNFLVSYMEIEEGKSPPPFFLLKMMSTKSKDAPDTVESFEWEKVKASIKTNDVASLLTKSDNLLV